MHPHRRDFLRFVGATAAVTTAASARDPDPSAPHRRPFTPVRLPHPLPIYRRLPSFLATDVGGAGCVLSPTSDTRLAEYRVVDDLVLPPEFRAYTILRWGDRVYHDEAHYCGANHDWTALQPIGRFGTFAELFVNHETVSDPWRVNLNKVLAANGFPADYVVTDASVDALQAAGEALYNVGTSRVLVRRDGSGAYRVVPGHRRNRRVHGLSGLAIANVPGGRPDGKLVPTSWGPRPHQVGDDAYLEATGPAARDVFPTSVDGLGARIVGTNANCSGGRTPWGSFVSCEENVQSRVTEAVDSFGHQLGYTQELGDTFGLVGEKYGWCVEFLAGRPGLHRRPRKHTSLGRFRHENITFHAQRGAPLVAYMGDDRRGGHTYKWVSAQPMKLRPTDVRNSALLEDGTLYGARFHADGTGEWIPLELATPIRPNVPSELSEVEFAALGSATRDGLVFLPQRPGVGSGVIDGGSLAITRANEARQLPAYLAAGSTLGDFYANEGALLVDSFHACNLVGATPTGRPEDLELNPRHPRELLIAYTDGIAGSSGYADSRIFTVNKLDALADGEQPCGGLFRLREDERNDESRTFTWEKFAKGGEAGAVSGAGFANVDNLAFDAAGNVWCVTDMSTSRQNSIRTGSNPGTRPIVHAQAGDFDEEVGVFGNNWLFCVPTSGPDAGEVVPFAYGPVKCELTGPTFFGDTLVLSVQHPGEGMPTDEAIDLDPKGPLYPPLTLELLDLDGSLFTQTRTVPLSSEWPREIQGNQRRLPQSATVGIVRRSADTGRGFPGDD